MSRSLHLAAISLLVLVASELPLAQAQGLTPHQFPVSTPASSPIDAARQSSRDQDWARKRKDEIQAILQDPAKLRAAKILFIGDSITQFWATNYPNVWTGTFGNPRSAYHAVNLGFSGDRTENLLLHLVPQRDGGEGYFDSPTLDPDIIVLMIGVNNTWNGGPIVENVVAGNIAIIARLRQLRPRATIIIQSLLPAGSGDRDKQYIVPINRLLRQMIQGFGPKVVWLDLYPLFVSPDGSPNANLFVDGVHPNANGYERWSPELLKTIRGINSRAPTIGSPVTARQR